jgi:uncharacterized membrane protein YdfJ with MMPL/SSD domain
MVRLARWCIAHRVRVVVAWVAVALLTTFLAGSVGNRYATNFNLPGTESQHVSDLLTREFRAQSGDVDTIVFHVSTRHGRRARGACRDRAGASPAEHLPPCCRGGQSL